VAASITGWYLRLMTTSRGSEATTGASSARSSTTTESPRTRCSMRSPERRRIATAADGPIGSAVAGAPVIVGHPRDGLGEQWRKAAARRERQEAEEGAAQAGGVPGHAVPADRSGTGMPAPSTSTAAVGTAPVKSSLVRPARAATLVIATRSRRGPPAGRSVDHVT
jgi:hypothetical protein